MFKVDNKATKTTPLAPATLLKKETLAQVFSCEFCEISENTFFYSQRLIKRTIKQQHIETKMIVNLENDSRQIAQW